MKKGKAAKKAAIAVVTAVAVGGVSVGGYYGIRQAQKTTVKVYPVSDFTSGYWGDSMNMEGQITSTASQNIYLSDSQTISQVLVKEGDVVNAGDTLMTYDTSMIGPVISPLFRTLRPSQSHALPAIHSAATMQTFSSATSSPVSTGRIGKPAYSALSKIARKTAIPHSMP